MSKLSKKEAIEQLTELLMVYYGIPEKKFDNEFKILFVVEGHSAASGIRTNRDSRVVGVLALRGKILNVWQKTLANAMKSEIVKEFIRVLQDDSYDMIIICTDADADGSSISTLIIGCVERFRRDIIREGKLFNNLAPLYTVRDNKTQNLVTYGDDQNMSIPKGCTIHTNKGLGSYNADEIRKLILNPALGAEWELIIEDPEMNKYLDIALKSGGKEYVWKEGKNGEPVPFMPGITIAAPVV